MPSKAFIVNQEAPLAISHNQRSEIVKLALPAGKYALFASGLVISTGSDRAVDCFIETTTTIVAVAGVRLVQNSSFQPMPAMFGVLALSAADTVRVNCILTQFSPTGAAAATAFRLMAVSVDAIA